MKWRNWLLAAIGAAWMNALLATVAFRVNEGEFGGFFIASAIASAIATIAVGSYAHDERQSTLHKRVEAFKADLEAERREKYEWVEKYGELEAKLNARPSLARGAAESSKTAV